MADTQNATSDRSSKPAATTHPAGMENWKPGNEPPQNDAPGDFGAPAGESHPLERDYVSQNTKRSDPGVAQPRSGESANGTRTSGVGGSASGDGSSSGGDINTDVIGIGTGSGVAVSGPDDEPGADDVFSDESVSDVFASGGHAKGEKEIDARRIGRDDRVKGSTVSVGDDRTTAPVGADSATTSAHDDDSFAGEISSGEAGGQDGTT